MPRGHLSDLRGTSVKANCDKKVAFSTFRFISNLPFTPFSCDSLRMGVFRCEGEVYVDLCV